MDNNTESTNNFLDWVEIKNFKSIKDLRLDCKRVNVFIGKPNVGKSNILEALGLLGAEYSTGSFLNGFVRYEDLKHLYYDNDTTQPIQIITNNEAALLLRLNSLDESKVKYNYFRDESNRLQSILRKFALELSDELHIAALHKFTLKQNGEFVNKTNGITPFQNLGNIKKYDFNNITKFENLFSSFLLPPHGLNLFSVVDRHKDFKNEFGKLFAEQQLELVLSREEQIFELQKRDGYYVYKYPYFSIADTFRRFVFYLVAIESNKDSVIVLEEPEVHSFPPYIQTLAFRMIESETNQFFVSTHSPYLLQTLIENLKDDQLNVFITYYEDYQTKVRALTPEELSEVQEYSIDVFYNLRRFTPPINA